jgi:hypothetical protein
MEKVLEHPWADDAVDDCGETAGSVGVRGPGDGVEDHVVLAVGRGLVRGDRAGDDVLPEVVGVQVHGWVVALPKLARERCLARPRRTGQDDQPAGPVSHDYSFPGRSR